MFTFAIVSVFSIFTIFFVFVLSSEETTRSDDEDSDSTGVVSAFSTALALARASSMLS